MGSSLKKAKKNSGDHFPEFTIKGKAVQTKSGMDEWILLAGIAGVDSRIIEMARELTEKRYAQTPARSVPSSGNDLTTGDAHPDGGPSR